MIVGAHNIITSLGWTSDENYAKVSSGIGGVEILSDPTLSDVPIPASVIDTDELQKKVNEDVQLKNLTKLEQLCALSLKEVLSSVDPTSARTGFIFSTTKGNVDLLQESSDNADVLLSSTAEKIKNLYKFSNEPHIISNACISGLTAFIVAKRFIDAGLYDDVVVLGADILSKFIVSGFQSFQSLSPEPCKPFDANRDGLSLGEGVASVVLHKENKTNKTNYIEVVNGAIANDANHISGPSRNGEGLYRAIVNTIGTDSKVDTISAHGTATPFNDDMESHGISRSGLSTVPVSGLKGYFGHTLGAAGVIESIISIMAMQNDLIIGTKGLIDQGVVESIHVQKEHKKVPVNSLLKLMSGFGGCNAAVYFKKHGKS